MRPKWTQQTYEMVAGVLARAAWSLSRESIAHDFADRFAEDNPRFDRLKFTRRATGATDNS